MAMTDAVTIETHRLEDDGRIPNNAALPLVVYHGVLALSAGDPAAECQATFARNGWTGGWRDGIFDYHHYHAMTHEVLGIVRGEARVRFGGDGGPLVTVREGDVVVIPAGVGHKNEGASDDLLVVGAYPAGMEPDICTGTAEEHARARQSIPRVAVPASDPVVGERGPLQEQWRGA